MQEIKYIPLDQLKPHPENPRLIKDKDFEILCKSIKDNPDYFETRPILCNPQMVIFAGNMRYRAAQHLQLKEVPVAIMDVSEERQREIMMRDNLHQGKFDFNMLANLDFGTDFLSNVGFSKFEIKKLTGEEEADAKPNGYVYDCPHCGKKITLSNRVKKLDKAE